MKKTTEIILEELLINYPILTEIKNDLIYAFKSLENTVNNDNKIMVCGNGGSCSDSGHIVGELMKSFKKKRTIDETVKQNLEGFGEEGRELALRLEGAIPAISLCIQDAFSTAFLNDNNPYMVYAQQLYGLGKENDLLFVISTSGNAKNCIYAAITAKAKGIKIIALTGKTGGKLKDLSDICIKIPQTETYKIQELHLPVYHCLCAMLEEEIW